MSDPCTECGQDTGHFSYLIDGNPAKRICNACYIYKEIGNPSPEAAEIAQLRASLTATQAKVGERERAHEFLEDYRIRGESIVQLNTALAVVEAERDQALARAERAEGERDAEAERRAILEAEREHIHNALGVPESHIGEDDIDCPAEIRSIKAKLAEAEGLLRETREYVCLTEYEGRTQEELRDEYPASGERVDELRSRIDAALGRGAGEKS